VASNFLCAIFKSPSPKPENHSQALEQVLNFRFCRIIIILQRESEPIAADENRIRENMKALKGTCEEKALLQSYLGQLDSEESPWFDCVRKRPT
jgi:hypothetical protein